MPRQIGRPNQLIPKDLIVALSTKLPQQLANDLVEQFIELKKDVSSGILSRSSCGKFTETVVQVLQFLETGTYDQGPAVDSYLKGLENRKSILPDDLRICASRVARTCYTFRNKRNIAHKGLVDPNTYDLRYTFFCAQWLLSEFFRQVMATDMTQAGRIIEYIQIPVSSIVEQIENRRIVYGDLTVKEELLVLLHSYYPNFIDKKSINESMDRRAEKSISNSIKSLWDDKLLHRDQNGYRLTQEGYKKAEQIISRLMLNK